MNCAQALSRRGLEWIEEGFGYGRLPSPMPSNRARSNVVQKRLCVRTGARRGARSLLAVNLLVFPHPSGTE
jgi:hypothetical protein